MVSFNTPRPPDSPPPPAPPPRPGPPPRYKSASTVHLCAAAYIDQGFRDQVLRDVYHRPHRALAPNPGTDPVPVIQHALHARALSLVRTSLVLVLGLIVLVADPASFLGATAILVLWQAVVSALRLLGEFSGSLRRGQKRDWVNLFVRFVMTGVFFWGGMLVVFAGAAAFTFATQNSDTAVIGGGTQSSQDGSGGDLTLLWIVLLAIITVSFELAGIWRLKSMPVGSEPPIGSDRRLGFIAANQDPQVVNYSAERKPFVGAGDEIRTWQFAVPLRRKRSGTGQYSSPWPHFTTDSLNERVKEAIAALAHDSDRSKRLPGLQLSDNVFVSGRDTVRPTHTVPELAESGYPHRTLADIRDDPTTALRHYLRCQIISWGGELVTTVFVHTALQGETLYMEFSSYVLPPTRAEYHAFGRDSSGRGAAMLGGALRSLVRLPALTGRGIIDLFKVSREAVGRAGADQSPQWSFRGADDFGAEVGIRELGSDEIPHNYFQFRDSVKYIKILERQLLAAVVDYLDDKIDTYELTNRAETIVNAGLVNYGTIQAGAVGAGSSAQVGAVGDRSEGTVSVQEGTK